MTHIEEMLDVLRTEHEVVVHMIRVLERKMKFEELKRAAKPVARLDAKPGKTTRKARVN